ncbi:Mak10 subunit, NatC N-terminal acetyltransferase-domain-containing protein [Parasitella parasitica]|nr:Mak10 subunit, NatC N-terminal acetyltransferase-domain-containing protein [Parasitella parasitica]
MQHPLGDLHDAFTELNINIPNVEEQQEYLLPQWKDITLLLDEATDDFEVGQLVHLQSFTLFDAMSAIEIMDPRMDTGMTIEETFKKFDIDKRLMPEDILGIMDRLIVREMAWISGHSLAQTVYTCIYFHHIKHLNESSMPTLKSTMSDILYGVLRSYILATVKCCHYIWTEMTQGNVYEEEDFTTNLFGLSFNNQNPDVMIINDIDSSVMLLNHLLNTKISESEKNTVRAILNRVEIRRSYLMSLVYLSKLEGSFLPTAKSELTKIIELLQNVDLSIGNEVSDAFDSNINRKLTSQTPPRPVELSSLEESFKEYALLIQRLSSICDVNDYPSVNSLMNYFLNFAAHQPYPDAFSRSKLVSIFFHNQRIFGTMEVSTFILESIKETVQPPLWWTSPTRQPANVNPAEFINAHDTLKAYLDRISVVFVEYFKINCHNRSRQRRMLCKVVAEWEILQEEAAGVDEVFHALERDQEDVQTPYYFSSWAYNLKLTMIEKILYLGFELDLYGSHEYIMIYWYIQCVLGSRAYLLDRISNFMDQTIKKPDVYNYLGTSQMTNHSKKCLSEAMLKLLLTIKHTNQFDQRALVFDDEETRYAHRFKSFVSLISPPHLTYQQYSEIVNIENFDAPRMREIIKNDFAESKKTLEGLLTMTPTETNTEMCHDDFKDDIKNMIRTIVANNIGLNYISETPPKTNLDTKFKYHPWFPIISKN